MKTTLVSMFLTLSIVLITFAQDVAYIPLEEDPGSFPAVFSPDGSTLASLGRDGIIRLWDVATGTLIKTFKKHAGRFDSTSKSLVFSPDGGTLATNVSHDPTIHLWDVATGTPIKRLSGPTDDLHSVVYSPDGGTLASGGLNDIYLWDVATGTLVKILSGHTSGVPSVAFSPDGGMLASGGWDRTVRLWDVATGKDLKTLTGHSDAVTSVAFSPDGNTLASGGGLGDRTVRLWEVTTGQFIKSLRHRDAVLSVAFSPDGGMLAVGNEEPSIRLWDIARSLEIKTLTGHRSSVGSVAFSSTGRYLASGSLGSTIRLWKLTLPATRVHITPSPVVSPKIGQQLTLNLSIVEGENIGGYQAAVRWDNTALRYVSSTRGDYLPETFFVPPVVVELNRVLLGASTLGGVSSGDGTLATITFEVIKVKESTLDLSDVVLTDGEGEQLANLSLGGFVVVSLSEEDVNQDGVVDILDLVLVSSHFGEDARGRKIDVNRDGIVNVVDLVKVAAALGAGAAPSAIPIELEFAPTSAEVQMWLAEARWLNLTDASSQRGIRLLEQLLAALLTLKETALLPNYPNPFNPETWIPYQLARPADVTVTVYAANGGIVRTLVLGHQPAGVYAIRSRAAYWDGRNQLGERVATGVYFYTLTAGEFRATRKMLILK